MMSIGYYLIGIAILDKNNVVFKKRCTSPG